MFPLQALGAENASVLASPQPQLYDLRPSNLSQFPFLKMSILTVFIF